MIHYSNLSNANTAEGYLYITLEGKYTQDSCRRFLQELNNECRRHGYEAVMINLGQLSQMFSVGDVCRSLTTPKAISMLPFRVAWVNGGEIWDKDWKRMEFAIRYLRLNWRNFSDLKSAEEWLVLNRHKALAC